MFIKVIIVLVTDNNINYKKRMKNYICIKGVQPITQPTVWYNAPPPPPHNLKEQFTLNNYSKIRVQTEFLLKIKNNYDVINVFRKVIIIFVTDNDKLINKV